jgi:hypothetical protein
LHGTAIDAHALGILRAVAMLATRWLIAQARPDLQTTTGVVVHGIARPSQADLWT